MLEKSFYYFSYTNKKAGGSFDLIFLTGQHTHSKEQTEVQVNKCIKMQSSDGQMDYNKIQETYLDTRGRDIQTFLGNKVWCTGKVMALHFDESFDFDTSFFSRQNSLNIYCFIKNIKQDLSWGHLQTCKKVF